MAANDDRLNKIHIYLIENYYWKWLFFTTIVYILASIYF